MRTNAHSERRRCEYWSAGHNDIHDSLQSRNSLRVVRWRERSRTFDCLCSRRQWSRAQWLPSKDDSECDRQLIPHVNVHKMFAAYQNTNTAIGVELSVVLLRLLKIRIEVHVRHVWILSILCVGIRIEHIPIIIRCVRWKQIRISQGWTT